MKKFKRLLTILLTLGMVAGMCMAAQADTASVIGPVNCEWSDLHMDATGYLSWKMTLPEGYKDLEVQKYTISIDIMTTGVWRTGYRTLTATETSKDITYGTVGIYRYRVQATFVGGLVSNMSGYSNDCTVTSDYVTKSSDTGSTSGGPGTSSGSTASYGPGTVSSSGGQVPDWAEKYGQWIKQDGNWYYVNNGETYKNKWACIYNPYAKTGLGQRAYDWFCFDENGCMRTGWYVDPAGNVFYLSPVSDGSKGKMVTGWQQIDGYWYYFNPQEGSGTMGAMLVSTTVDGHRLDSAGRRVS